MPKELLTSEEAQKRSSEVVYGRTFQEREAYRHEQERIQKAHRAWVEDKYGMNTFNSATRYALYQRAWEEGRSVSFSSVEYAYRRLADLILLAVSDR